MKASKDKGAKLTNDELLLIYGLFKQGTVGDVNTDKPGIFSPTERAKWDAWNSQKGKSKEQAQNEYVEAARGLLNKYGIGAGF